MFACFRHRAVLTGVPETETGPFVPLGAEDRVRGMMIPALFLCPGERDGTYDMLRFSTFFSAGDPKNAEEKELFRNTMCSSAIVAYPADASGYFIFNDET
jgi:hypothetical protein